MDINNIEHELENRVLSLCQKINNNQSTREFIEICYPNSKNSEGYGLFMFNLSLSIHSIGIYQIVLIPAGKCDTHKTFIHIFLFKDKEDKTKFKDKILQLHVELDQKVVKMFRGEE